LCANAADIRVVTSRTPAQARRMDKLQWRLIAKHGLAGARILRALADELDNLRRFAVGSNPAKLARRDAQGVGIHEPSHRCSPAGIAL
jgi:hypothetical protein